MLPPTLVLLRQSRYLLRRNPLPRYSASLRAFTTSSVIRNTSEVIPIEPARNTEDYVRHIRNRWGDNLPENLLSEAEYVIYERNYGAPTRLLSEEDIAELAEEARLTAQEIEDSLEPDAIIVGPTQVESKGRKSEEEEGADEVIEVTAEEVVDGEEPDGYRITAETEEEARALQMIQEDMKQALQNNEDFVEEEELGQGPEWERVHPLTKIGQFPTKPFTIPAPEYIRRPTEALLADVSNTHLNNSCHKNLGAGLVHSPIMTRKSAKVGNSIPLSPHDSFMSEMEANAFLAALTPGYYAQSLSALTEIRRRLGGDWVLGGGDEAGVKNVLELGTGGAAVLAWRDVIRAQQALRDDEETASTGIPKIDVPLTTEEVAAPAGIKATVVTSSDSLRFRMSKFLDNTQFIPRLPDAVQKGEYNVKQPRKLYDLIISTNTLLPIPFEKSRKPVLESLWSLLNPNGGVLVLIEKGTPTGFETIAHARSYLLEHFLPSPLNDPSKPAPETPGHIIAPCTNHSQCPMYTHGNAVGNRKDYCHFSQRYQRPPYLQRIIGASKSNHEDLRYSFVSFRRGVPLRTNDPEKTPQPEDFDLHKGHPSIAHTQHSIESLRAHAHTLPRLVFPPLKRHKHVILDVCTPEATIERWVVPKSFSKIAYHDARKSQWGDLWALSAKIKTPRNLRLGDKKRSPQTKIIRTADLTQGKATETIVELDRPGGKKANRGKRKRDRLSLENQIRKTREELDLENQAKEEKNRWRSREEMESDLWTKGTKWKEAKKTAEEDIEEMMELEDELKKAHERSKMKF